MFNEIIMDVSLGHGVYNNNFEINMYNYSKQFEDDTALINYNAQHNAPSGDCMVGISGTLCPVEVVKRKLLNLTSERWTLTIDMCRGLAMRGEGMKEKSHIILP